MIRLYLSIWLVLILNIVCAPKLLAQCAVHAGANISICNGQTTILRTTVTGGTPTTYSWSSIPAGASSSADSLIVTPAGTTTYIVSISGNGCNSTDTVIVTVKPVPATPTITFSPNNQCSGTNVSFSTPNQANVTFSWNFGDGTTATGRTATHQFTSYGNATGTFNVTAFATGANGCVSTSTQTVSVQQKPNAQLKQGSGVDTLFFNGTLTFYKCTNSAQTASNFNFINAANPSAGVTSTIIWGDTGANYTTSSVWTNISHVYARGIYSLTYIVTNSGNGCSDTTIYKVFFGSNAAGGISSLGNTNICGPANLTFIINNYQGNTPGTVYTVTFSDSTPPLTFSHPPPDTIVHLFQRSSCNFSSTNGVTTFNNSFSANLVVSNPCGVTAGSVLPIYVSLPPIANFTGGDAVCLNTTSIFTDSSQSGQAASNSGCDYSAYILWNVTPSTGWTLTSGSFGNDNGYTGVNYDPTSWTVGSSSIGLNFNTLGNYQIQLVAANGCSADTIIKTVCVTVAPSPSFTLAPNAGCIQLPVVTTNTTPSVGACSPPTYLWTITQDSFSCTGDSLNNYVFTGGTNSTSASPSLLFYNQGVYDIKMTAINGCGSFTTPKQTITVKEKPKVGIFAPSNFCLGTPITPADTSRACGGTISAYSWTFQGGIPATSSSANPGSVSFSTPGPHNITLALTNECGSTNAAMVVVVDTAPVPQPGPNKLLCSGDSVQIGSAPLAGLIYLWSPATGLSASNIANPEVLLTNVGTTPITQTYYLTVTNAGGCTGNDSVKVTVYPKATVNAGPSVTLCAGTSTALAGSFGGAATSITWTSSNGGTFSNNTSPTSNYTPSITNGTAILTITTDDPTGPCPAASDSMVVTVLSPPVANAGADDSICSGSSVQIGSANQVGYTYSWSPATGLSATNISNPFATLSTTGNTVLQQTYALFVSIASCSDTDSVTITVFPPAVANAGNTVSVCAGDSVQLNGSLSGAATSSTWTSASGTFSQPDSLVTYFHPSITSGVAVATLTTNQPPGACPASTSSVNIVVNAIPQVTNQPLTQNTCSGAPAVAISLTSDVPGATFSWVASSPNGVTGYTASGSTAVIPSQTFTNNSANAGLVIFTITATANSCPGPPVNDTFVVYPLPSVNPISPQTICSGTTTTLVTPTSPNAGATFSWTGAASGNLNSYATNGNGNIPAQIIFNSSSVIDSVVYTVSAVANGCPGPSTNFSIIVNPAPDVILPAAQTICSGTTTTAVNITSNIVGTTFTWTGTGTANITGFTASGTGDIPVQTITNSGNTTGSVIYTITPSGNNCPGIPQNYTITINPEPVASANPSPDTICSSVQTNIALTSTVANTTFSWIVNSPTSITGASNGNGNSIQQTLVNSSQSPQTVVYTIIPAANQCNGAPIIDNVVVNPAVTIQFTPGNQTICSAQNTQLVNITSPTTGINITWTSQANGLTGVAANGTNTIPVQTLTNSSNIADTAVYTVSSDYGGCPGQNDIYQIIVNPTPTAILPADQTICSGTSSTAVNLTSPVANTTYSWTGTAANGTTGFTPSGTTSTIPAQTLTNSTFTAGNVTYAITPTANSCPGPVASYTINVNPLPDVILPTNQTVCNGATTNAVNLTSNVTGTTFVWTSVATTGVTGNSASGNGDIPAQTLSNSVTQQGTVIFTITPTANNCDGPIVTYTDTVNPTPTVSFNPAPQTVCSGQPTQLVNITSPTPGVSITWTAIVPNGITGAQTQGTSTIPSQVFSNNTVDTFPQPLTINYTAQATTANTVCPGTPANYSITVEPIPSVDFNYSIDHGCSPLNVSFAAGSVNYGIPDSLVFNWGDGTPDVALYPSPQQPVWQQVSHMFYNNTSQVVTYNVSLIVHNACIDTTIIKPVTLLPNLISSFFTYSPTSGCEPLTVTFNDQSTGAGTLNWCWNFDRTTNTCIGGGTVSTPGSSVTHTFSAGSYTVALYINNGFGCAHDSSFQTINVTPSPTAAFTSTNNLCALIPVNFTEQATAPPAQSVTQFNWLFGDGDSSSVDNPTHAFANAGTYNVCLKITSSFGCTDSICNPVTILNRPIANFTFIDTCVNTQPTLFTNASTNAAFYQWDFGDGNTSSAVDPGNNYTSAGSYNVTLISSTNSCADTISHNIAVYPKPASGFTIPVSYNCGVPSSIQLTNTSIGAIGYAWDFGNSTSSTGNNPVAVYTASGTYDISLFASNQFNCFDTAKGSISIYPYPVIQSVDVQPSEGCQPVNVAFNANATDAATYVWSYGDGNNGTFNTSTTSHLYSDTGVYTVQLQVYSFGTCGDTAILIDTVKVHINPTAKFSYSIDETIEPENGTVVFTNASLNSSTYVWNFGDGATSTETNPTHLFPQVNTFEVMLIASSEFGCLDTAVQDIYIIKKSLYVPNAFAPDFDGPNGLVKVWQPAGNGLKDYRAQIFNAWGELLWESTALTSDLQPAEGWNGTYQGKLCAQDVYVWKIEATFVDGTRWKGMSYPKDNNPQRKTIGSVTLVR